MSKCIPCGATWTTSGLALCPICGAKAGAAEASPERLKPELSGARTSSTVAAASRLHRGTTVRIPPESLPPRVPAPPPPPPAARPVEDKAPVQAPEEKPAPPPAPEVKAPAAKPAEPAEERPAKPVRTEPTLPVPSRLIDSSVKILPAEMSAVPRVERPLNGPIILGALAMVTGVLFPLSLAFEGNRVFGVLGFCMSGFFVPFAPIAWIAGLMAERRRLEQGLEPEPRVVLGRLLGQWGTLLLIAEVTAALVLIAGLRLAGKLPGSFWAQSF
jgi:hypothetical protein